MIEWEIPDLTEVSSVAILGAGPSCEAVMDLASLCGWDILCIASKERQHRDFVSGIPICSLADLPGCGADRILVASFQGVKEQVAFLEENGFTFPDHWVFAADPFFFRGRKVTLALCPTFAYVKKIAIFGSGNAAEIALARVATLQWEISFIVDNNPNMWGKRLGATLIKSPDTLKGSDIDLIVVASGYGKRTIFAQLDKMGYRQGVDYLHFADPALML